MATFYFFCDYFYILFFFWILQKRFKRKQSQRVHIFKDEKMKHK